MGDLNQRLYVEERAERFRGPWLEVGSHDYGSDPGLRELFAGRGDWLGVDTKAGPGVDLALDLTADFATIDAALGGRRFGSVFCMSVLEHCEQPFQMARNIVGLLEPGGAACIAVPFVWKLHAYPSDYWRFTPDGVQALFRDLDFAAEDTRLASERDGEWLPVDDELGRVPFSHGAWRRRGHPLRGVVAGSLRWLARAGPLRWIAGSRYVMKPCQILMIGTRR